MHSRLCSRLTSAFGVLATALLVAVPSLDAQQTGTVTGRVTDSQGGAPIASVQIYIEGLNLGALTQQNGRYLLVNVPAGTHTVTAARIGYRTVTQEVSVGAGATVVQDIVLSEEALQLQEVIVTGTVGQTQRRALGNSVERLSAASVTEQAPISSLQSLMAARTPGLRFGRVDGQVGGGSGITIRGVSSVSLGSQPLIYVDGVRVQNDATLGPTTGGTSSNASALGDINPDQIESIEVIKGPSAATLYGTEASAGVIQIITKKGSVGAPEFTLETSQGTNFMVDPQGTLGTQYACAVTASQCLPGDIRPYEMYDEAGDYLRGTGRFAGFTPVTTGPASGRTAANFTPGDRTGDLFRNGYAQRYNASVRGGLDQVRYYLAGTFGDEVGVLDYNTNRQVSARSNVTVLLSENINVDIAMGYTQGATRFATVDGEGGIWHQLVWSRGGNLPGIQLPGGRGFLGFQERFPQSYEATDISREYSRFTASATATHTYGDWLTQRLIFGIDKGAETDNEFLPGQLDFPDAPNGAVTYGRPVDQNLTFDYSVSGAYQATPSLRATTSVGAQYYFRSRESVTTFGKDFATSVQTVISQTELADRSIGFSSIENKSLGFFAQEELNWQDRIYLTGAVRADDNSAFGGSFDLQYYPKLSASWVLSEESFFPAGGFVNSLRLRGAWGKSGRQPGTFAGQTLYSSIVGPNGNGLYPSTAGNSEIGPEVSQEIEVGFDVAFFEDRLSAEFSYYTTTTSDLLVSQSLAPSTGLTGTRQGNLGEMKNHGWETSLDARVYNSQTVAFDLALSADYTYNEITKLGQDILPSGNYQLGFPYPTIVTDYFITSAEMNAAGTNYNSATVMCDLGVNGGYTRADGSPGPNIFPGGPEGLCSTYTDEGILLGTSYPKYSFAVSPTLTLFNDLQVFAVAEGQYGRWIASTDANYACRFYRSCLKAVERTDPAFLAGTGLYYDDQYNGRYPADFWRLRQIGARYNLPQDLVGRIGADRASISVSANNPFMIWQKVDTDKAGNNIYDPEYANPGNTPNTTALWEMPSISSINAMVRVSF